jgi:hypothetical protein
MNEFDKIFNEQVEHLDEGVWDAIKGAGKAIAGAFAKKDGKQPITPEEISKAAKDAPKNWDESSAALADTVASGINTFARATIGKDPTKYMSAANTAKGKFITALDKAIKTKFTELQKEVTDSAKAEAAKAAKK